MCGNRFYKINFPESLVGYDIAHLQFLAILVGIKIWSHKLQGKFFIIYVDNEAVSIIINTGCSRDEFLQKCLRELAYSALKHEFITKAKHLLEVDNENLDLLSRWSYSSQIWVEFWEHTKNWNLVENECAEHMFEFTYDC